MERVKGQQESEKCWDGCRGAAPAAEVDNRKGWGEEGEAMQRLGKSLPEKVADALANRR